MSQKTSGAGREREIARAALRTLGLQGHPLFKRDPVRLLADHATGALASTEMVLVESQPQYNVLANCVVSASEHYITFSGDKDSSEGPTDTMPALTLPFGGVLNLQVIEGDWPKDPRKFVEGSLRLPLNGVLFVGTDEWALHLELDFEGPYLLEMRLFDEPAGANPDAYIRLTPKKSLAPLVEMSTSARKRGA